MKQALLVLPVLTLALGVASAGTALGQTDHSFERLRLQTPVDTVGFTAAPGSRVAGDALQQVIIRLAEPSVLERGAKGRAARDARRQIANGQDALLERILDADPSVEVIARVQLVLNAVFVSAPESVLVQFLDDPAVAQITRVADYNLDLADTVSSIGATAVQQFNNFDGTGVRVAVLDSGIDFTHQSLGGPGTVEFYAQCYDSPAENPPYNAQPLGDCAAYFGTGAPKVIGGYDFVGELWPNAPLLPDPNPIDFEGHGTHVADIIAGVNGVAPGASLYAVKVCSAVAGSCSGVALIQGMEYAVDPDGDGDPADAVDIINMSLGSNYGLPFDNMLALATDNASRLGVLTVASAGNSADNPFITGTPAAALSALSVAQTQVPSALFLPLLSVTSQVLGPFETAFQPWSSPLVSALEFPLAISDVDSCQPLTDDGALAGKIVLVGDIFSGSCFSPTRIANVIAAGAKAAIVSTTRPQPFVASYAGDEGTVPVVMITRTNEQALKQALGNGSVTVRLDPDNGIQLAQHMATTSSRGPSMQTIRIKPEIGAPGASISAIAGSGDRNTSFGGTSGAAPMVAGAAALLRQAHPERSGQELKALLMNTAENTVLNTRAGELAPITRIGAGEVRVERAVNASAAAWIRDEPSAALSFGFHNVARENHFVRQFVMVRNYANYAQTFSITPSFRFADDEANGAVQVEVQTSVDVGPNATARVPVALRIDGSRLPAWNLNSGLNGGNGNALTAVEFDGYLTLASTDGSIHLPWHVLPRAAADVRVQGKNRLRNQGLIPARLEAYHLAASSPNLPIGEAGTNSPVPDLRYGGYATIPEGCGSDGDLLLFAVNTWEPQTHAHYPASLSVLMDRNGNGQTDYEIYTARLNDNRNVTFVYNYNTFQQSARFATDHDTNSTNTVMRACSIQFGGASAGTLGQVSLQFAAYDSYFTGNRTDITEAVTVNLQTPVPVFANSETSEAVLERNAQTTVSGPGPKLILVRGAVAEFGEAVTVP